MTIKKLKGYFWADLLTTCQNVSTMIVMIFLMTLILGQSKNQGNLIILLIMVQTIAKEADCKSALRAFWATCPTTSKIRNINS